uniref:Uncharacterized protein n=1 Tax=Spongospora subterranea TaxID=70186 RepID=A0A0H5R3D2_9EUKA|eukprot:CRZ02484.1 hypothetical protein [Spongospora subterranea]
MQRGAPRSTLSPDCSSDTAWPPIREQMSITSHGTEIHKLVFFSITCLSIRSRLVLWAKGCLSPWIFEFLSFDIYWVSQSVSGIEFAANGSAQCPFAYTEIVKAGNLPAALLQKGDWSATKCPSENPFES